MNDSLRPLRQVIAASLLCSLVFTVHTLVRAEESSAPPAATSSKTELESLIQARTQALDQINRHLLETKQNLEATKTERLTLQGQVSRLQSNIKQLDLNIQADQITAQKLGLELESLGYDIQDIELSMESKRESAGDVLREMQKRDHANLLVVLLGGNSLSETLSETESLVNLQGQLAEDIASLNDLHRALAGKLDLVHAKRSEIEIHQQNLGARKAIVEDQKEEHQIILVQTKNKESLYEQQVAELEKQQNAIEDEIENIEDRLRSEFNTDLLPSKHSGVFDWPVKLTSGGGSGRITQHFGEKSRLYRGKPHNGLDIGTPIGTPVYAAADGIVMAADNNDVSSWKKYQYGKYVLLKHSNNFATLYAHLSRYVVAKGQSVKRGEIIGYSGSTGYSTGPHLHFGLYWAPSILMKSIPPAAGLVPIGVVLSPEDYL